MRPTPFERLVELQHFIEDQVNIEECRPNYIGSQRAIAYNRVLRRLVPIIRAARRVQDELNLPDPRPRQTRT